MKMKDSELPAVEMLAPGQWYMWTTNNGFTMFGQYVGPLPMGQHQFAHVCHMRNAGKMWLFEIARSGPGKEVVLSPPCPLWSGSVSWWVPYTAEAKPWTKKQH